MKDLDIRLLDRQAARESVIRTIEGLAREARRVVKIHPCGTGSAYRRERARLFRAALRAVMGA
ncbi:hypothetical protein [Longimicrobium sp.]|uniref:hypothetical protein n=1 Tax=Longimicrobium sp. TaxID=2029185 RepID=UPI002E36D579|nr:hypothetical protein [Longimicrobium sp.]HEX6038880.1 hypothetical protein [Longimicrobium sp.]